MPRWLIYLIALLVILVIIVILAEHFQFSAH
jgi:t-SNARE complex subunit (syntaxin)